MTKIIKKAHTHRDNRLYKGEILDNTGEVKYEKGKIIPDQAPLAIPVKFQKQNQMTEQQKMLRMMNIQTTIDRAIKEEGIDTPEDLVRFSDQVNKAFKEMPSKFRDTKGLSEGEYTELIEEFKMEHGYDPTESNTDPEQIGQDTISDIQDIGENKGGDTTNNDDIPSVQTEVTHPHNRMEG